MNNIGYVHSLESFGLVDGPGVRFVVFLKGCPMRCKYCHNPDTWAQPGGNPWTADDLFQKVYRYHRYWGEQGGITVSGGEPLLQMEFLTEFFRIAKKHNIHTALDTSGQPFSKDEEFLQKFDKLLVYTDLVLLDLKLMDESGHKKLTGHTNSNILQMAEYLSEKEIPVWIRHVLVPSYTDDEKDLNQMARFVTSLHNVERVEILPYHTMGKQKWEKLGICYPLDGVRTPTEEEVDRASEILKI